MQKWGERIYSNRQLGMRVYIRIVMIMVLIKRNRKESVKHALFIYYLLLKWLHVSTLQGHHQAFI